MKSSGIEILLRSKYTVFSFTDLALLWGEIDVNNIKAKVNYYVKAEKLYPIRRGIYGKDKNYNKLELATKIYSPAYISFETTLRQEGVIFQHYGTIFAASYLSREITVDGQIYSYRKLKNSILANPAGLVKKAGYMEACKERAFMDAIYLYGNYHFDNLRGIKWDFCFELLPIYDNKALEKKLKSYLTGNAYKP